MPRFITSKTILSAYKKPDPWFGIHYNMNLYRGCQHQCIYCDSRSEVYQLGDLADIRIKENALLILEKELKAKRKRGTVGFGSMNDPYMPVEKKEELVRGALKLMISYRFPVHLITKSNLVVRDLDLLTELSKNYAAISFTITTINNELAKIIEPAAPTPDRRLAALNELSQADIYTGITFMPQLPFINDTWEETEALVVAAVENGAKYILYAPGMTLRQGSREYYYQKLDTHFPGLKEKYMQQFGTDYSLASAHAKTLLDKTKKLCAKLNLPMHMQHWKDDKPDQLSLFN